MCSKSLNFAEINSFNCRIWNLELEDDLEISYWNALICQRENTEPESHLLKLIQGVRNRTISNLSVKPIDFISSISTELLYFFSGSSALTLVQAIMISHLIPTVLDLISLPTSPHLQNISDHSYSSA